MPGTEWDALFMNLLLQTLKYFSWAMPFVRYFIHLFTMQTFIKHFVIHQESQG